MRDLKEKYPELYDSDFFFECGPGWYGILKKMSEKLSAIGGVSVSQVKEKYGTLRVYADHDGTPIETDFWAVIDEAEKASEYVCEQCASPGTLTGTNWYKTLCDVCAGEKENA